MYEAVIEWVPVSSEERLKVATPLLSVPVPSELVPSKKVTVPVGVPVPGETAETVDVRRTDWPKTVAEDDAEREVVVSAALTVSVTRLEADGLTSVSPPMRANKTWVPTEKVEIGNETEALVPEMAAAVTTLAFSKRNSPPRRVSGLGELMDIVASNVTCCP